MKYIFATVVVVALLGMAFYLYQEENKSGLELEIEGGDSSDGLL